MDDPTVEPLGTPTANYGWTKPTVGGDNNAWGGMINTDLDGIDSTVHSIQTSVPAASTANPQPPGTAASGTHTPYSREDHVHPSDPTKLDATAAAGGDLIGNYPNPTLATTSVIAGAYTNAAITVDAKGRLTAASSGATPVSPSTVTPLPDGTAALGTDAGFARGDHVHPTDTSRAPLASPALTGSPTAPTQTPGTANTTLATTAFVAAAVAGPFTYGVLPAEVQMLPIAFAYSGKPAAGALIIATMVMAVTVAANLSGSKAFCSTVPAASATFTLKKSSSGTVTTFGTIVFATSGVATFSGAGGSLAIGDVLFMQGPGTQDTQLSDVGITIMAMRV